MNYFYFIYVSYVSTNLILAEDSVWNYTIIYENTQWRIISETSSIQSLEHLFSGMLVIIVTWRVDIRIFNAKFMKYPFKSKYGLISVLDRTICYVFITLMCVGVRRT